MLREITSENEGRAIDLSLSVIEREAKEGQIRLAVAGLHLGERVGFEILMATKAGAIRLSERIQLRPARVSISSEGSESDAFARAVAHAYGFPVSEAAKMPPRLDFEAMSLEGDPGNLDAGLVRIKLFYDGPDGKRDDDVAPLGSFEWFLVIDVASGVVALKEKWSVYRENIVSALCVLVN